MQKTALIPPDAEAILRVVRENLVDASALDPALEGRLLTLLIRGRSLRLPVYKKWSEGIRKCDPMIYSMWAPRHQERQDQAPPTRIVQPVGRATPARPR
jgi:hypothetical protein